MLLTIDLQNDNRTKNSEYKIIFGFMNYLILKYFKIITKTHKANQYV